MTMASVEFVRFKKLLKSRGNFVTMPRMRLFGLLQKHTALTIGELIHKTTKHDRVTVYRNIDLFEKLGIVTRVQLGGQTKVELSDMFQHHHHHMTCLNCGKVFVLKENKIIETELARIGHGTHFKITDHQLEIRGLCSKCIQ